MAGHVVEQALPLLAAANNHGDVAIKLSSLKQVKDIILASDPSLSVDLFPYLVDLQSSPERLVRKYLLEVIEAIVENGLAHSSILMTILLTLLKDHDPLVAKQAIVTGTNIFCKVLEDLSLQFHRLLRVERWLDDLWTWMVDFKDSVHKLFFEDGPIGPKLLAVKFLEICILLFTDDTNGSDKRVVEDPGRHRRTFNVSRLVGRHPVLDPAVLSVDAKRSLKLLMNLLQSASSVPALLSISTINSLATIARKRPVYYSDVLSVMFEFNSYFDMSKGGHTVSIQYSIRTALLGFLKCTPPIIIESREGLLKALTAMNAGEAADHVIRQVEKMMRSYERASHDAHSNKDAHVLECHPASGSLIKNRPLPTDHEDLSTSNDTTSKRIRYLPNNVVTSMDACGLNHVDGLSAQISLLDNDLTPVEQMIARIGALIAEGESVVEYLEMLISTIQPDMLADIVITIMKHLPRNHPPLTKLSNLSLNQSNDSRGYVVPVTTTEIQISSLSDISTATDLTSDIRRDPRRDPRRLASKSSAAPVGVNNDYFG